MTLSLITILAQQASCFSTPASLGRTTFQTTQSKSKSKSKSKSTQSTTGTALSMGIKTEVATRVVKAASKLPGGTTTAAIAATAVLGTAGVKFVLDNPSRKYEDGSVAREYDAWTQDGILEYYWGEHIHLGYYDEKE